MDIYTYQEKSFETVLYPEKGSGNMGALSYVGLGMGESGEVQLKIQDYIKKNNKYIEQTEREKENFFEEILDELGDYFWYGAGLATELGINLADEVPISTPHFRWDIELSGLGLGISGLVQNELKKIIRDDNGIVTEERLLKLTHLLASYIQAGYEVCNSIKIRPSIVFQRNIDKLTSRKERGVIQGSGDSR